MSCLLALSSVQQVLREHPLCAGHHCRPRAKQTRSWPSLSPRSTGEEENEQGLTESFLLLLTAVEKNTAGQAGQECWYAWEGVVPIGSGTLNRVAQEDLHER